MRRRVFVQSLFIILLSYINYHYYTVLLLLLLLLWCATRGVLALLLFICVVQGALEGHTDDVLWRFVVNRCTVVKACLSPKCNSDLFLLQKRTPIRSNTVYTGLATSQKKRKKDAATLR